ncbi:YuzD family protein [Bacillus sp. FJAT-50079]|uniref:YuzD family protein n=1 Tax=Bacillus sp. FJAT-50079 TaxID=2833577 RepID=UPI001BC8E032|nr:YuzD family protein [Bacillus sp. FJAT-50079]MBS4208535.1 YuzD family protein [Bacillus sp. FJAT-50079]
MRKKLDIFVYGAEQICASCVGLPSSRETYEWLEAAISRKYPNQPFSIFYIDIFNPPNEKHQQICLQILEDDMFYPVVKIAGRIVGEGNPRLKNIFTVMEQYGYR